MYGCSGGMPKNYTILMGLPKSQALCEHKKLKTFTGMLSGQPGKDADAPSPP
jgi:hypothetical protein